MKSAAIRFAVLLLIISPVSFAAESWSGLLVDSTCYDTVHQNTQRWDTRDTTLDVELCAPNAKTRSFALVQKGSQTFKFDSAGDTKAAELVRKTANGTPYFVTVIGEREQNILKVDSISMLILLPD